MTISMIIFPLSCIFLFQNVNAKNDQPCSEGGGIPQSMITRCTPHANTKGC